MKKRLFWVLSMALILVVAVGLVGCSSEEKKSGEESTSTTTENKPTITISSKTFTENLLLGQMLYDYLEYLGYPVENQIGLGETAVLRPALLSGEIDEYWEYTGTAVTFLMEHEPEYEEEKCFNLAKEWDAENDIIWLDYAPLNDTYAFVVRKDIADQYGWTKFSEAAQFINDGGHLKLASGEEFFVRPDGLPRIEEVYGFKYPKEDLINVSMGLSIETMKTGDTDLNIPNSTDPKIKTYNLVALEDDMKAFPVYNPAPLFRKEIIDAYPELPEQVKKLSQLLDTDTIIILNGEVDLNGKNEEEVSKAFLTENSLIK